MALIPIILAGGSGTRLWPYSRELYPKQLLPLVDGRTMLQNTVSRLSGLDDISPPIVICNENHRFLVAEQLRAIDIDPAAIILEPVGKNTAAAVAVAALKAKSLAQDAILLILPADHHIESTEPLHQAIRMGMHCAGQNHLITFGIVPDYPETGYGYIQKGDRFASVDSNYEAYNVAGFVEKPDRETARHYVESGEYLWNSGMFMFLGSRILDELSRFAAPIVDACERAYTKGVQDLDFFRLDAGAFSACPSESIDYAVMEKTQNGVVIPLSAGWNDLGSWDALWAINSKDENQNVTVGDVLAVDVKDSYLHATSRLVAVVGIENCVVVETADAVLISSRDKVQDVKLLVSRLKTGNREEALVHRKVFRPWGSYECLNLEERFQVKRITVNPGAKLSLQRHHHRAEHWVVVHGTARVTRGDEEVLLKEDESTYIPIGINHRLENPGKIPLEIIEIQSGSYLGEDDIVRFDDAYGRSISE